MLLEERHHTDYLQGPNELLLKLNCTGLCMSDIHFM
jgi:D-arabinose 1-dehydrogenase-like Zn-dependent alcohol dehydrogenase